jgi:serine/threonine-protein kinase RsbW
MFFTLTINNNLSELHTLHKHIQSMGKKLSLTKRSTLEINLVLDELITNIIEHGDQNNAHRIDVSLETKGKILTITVTDDGPQFDPTICPTPDTTLPLEKRKCGGLGILFVRKFSDCCIYERSDNKNIVTLMKSLPNN